MKASVLGGRSQAFSHVGDKFDGGDARQKHIRSGFGRHEGCETCDLDRRAPICLRYHENAFRWVLGANQWIFRLWVKPDGPSELAVIDPTSQHELILVFDVRVNKIKENPALDAIVRLRWIIGRPVRQTATNQPVSIIAAAGLPLARYGLTSWIEAAYVCADGTADPLRISRTISIDILEIVQLVGRNPSRRAIRVR
jgi:hypothetical protein